MNRAERRRLARAERKRASEKALSIKPSEFAKFEEQTLANAIDAYFDFTTVCFALVLHDEFGFGGKRIMRAMDKVREVYGDMESSENYYHQAVERLQTETNVEFETRVLK